jgi:hypothetical protein
MESQQYGRDIERNAPNFANEPLSPSLLPPELAAFLRTQELACLTHATDRGTVFVIKAPESIIQSVQGRVPIQVRHELYDHPAAPVIGILTTIYDQPQSPLWLETFINANDADQHADYATLAEQRELFMLFYDEGLRHRLTKAVGGLEPQAMREVLRRADRYLATIPPERFDFDLAKRAVMEAPLS